MTLMIQGKMGITRTKYLWFLVILLCVSLAVSLDYKRQSEEAFINQLVDPATGEIDNNLAELLSVRCQKDFNNLKEAFEDLKLHLLEETPGTTNDINANGCSLAKQNVNKLINVIHPQLRQALADCIRNNNLLFQVSGEDSGFTTWYTRYIESFFRWDDVPRRILATPSSPVLNSGPAPAPAPAPGPAPVPSPASVSPGFVPKSPKSPPSPRPKPSHQAAPPKADIVDVQSPVDTNSEDGGTDNSKTIIIACVVTAAVTFIIAALFFLLCFRRGSGAKRNDESPLLSLSLSENSGGSSHGYNFESIKEQKLSNDSSLHKRASTNSSVYLESDAVQISLDGKPSFGAVAGLTNASAESSDASGNTNSLLPLPPGRMGTPGLPPLKPPPGRADPFPLEPPAPIRPSPPLPPPVPSRASPPPPPAPPPSMKPASANVGHRPPGPPPPPAPPGAKPGPRPPPPPNSGPTPPRPPPPIPSGSKMARPPTGPQRTSNAEGSGIGDDAHAHKTKLKPFFWDKVSANPEHSMVWNQIKSGSFQFNEEMIETLFGYAPAEKSKSGKKQSQDPVPQYVQLLDPKKSQNLAILLRALNVTTEEVCDALLEGNELPVELLQTLLKMAPTTEEELRLRMFNGEISQLGSAERFLKVLVDIPFAFKRLETLLLMCTLHEEVAVTKESFETLEVACKELRSSRLFLKLLEAVLKTGNRMNDGTFRGGAQAFKLDTLLKLSDVKGVDGKTTLLHFVVQEIIRTEGLRAARVARESKSFTSIKSDDLLEDVTPETDDHYRSLGLEVVSRLSGELENVKKAAALDAENLTGTVAKLGHGLLKTRDFLNSEMKSAEEQSGFHEALKSFVQDSEVDVMSLLEEEKRIMALVKSTGDYFHGNVQKDEGLRLFTIVRDFLIILDKVCKEIRDAPKKPAQVQKKQVSNPSSSSESRLESPSPDPRQKLFPAIAERRMNDSSSSSSSDDET